MKIILCESVKIKHNTLLIKLNQVENIKSVSLFKSIANALRWMNIPLTDRKVEFYDRQIPI